ncbi:MAG: hypothetical protein EP332_01490 [Bacteroidetes bacterium]|nr:MAG: hypothetical protein EP332_01490 [Bacteroidota bacterium]
MNQKLNSRWLLSGVYYGLYMFIVIAIGWALLNKEELNGLSLLKQFAWWLPAGILFEYLRHRFTSLKK